MPRFDMDDQRGLAFAFGVVGLTTELILFYITNRSLPGELTGAFGTMVMGPVLAQAVEKNGERRERERRESQDSPSTRPPSSSPERSERQEVGK